jgi:uncharacterized protein YfbU (UPF0304 family)
MDLTLFERRVLANQYRILEKLDPPGASDHEAIYEALESGYALEYDEAFTGMSDELSKEECNLVWNSMSLFLALQRSAASLPDRVGLDEWRLKFQGFDGNNETSYMAYARYILEKRQRFTDLGLGEDRVNSHTEMVPTYRAMFAKWKNDYGKRYDLSREEIDTLLAID